MNDTELVSAIKAYTENTFPTTPASGGLSSAEQLTLFIKQAEQRIYNAVPVLATRKQGTISLTQSASTANPPTDFMSPYSLAIVDGTTRSFLLNKESTFLYEAFPDSSVEGIPEYYALLKNDGEEYVLLFAPASDDDYDIVVDYYYYPESIMDAGTSWLGENFDSVLLYGSLLEAFAFMQAEEDVLAQVQKRYDEAFALLKQYVEGKLRQDNYRTPPVRYPVR